MKTVEIDIDVLNLDGSTPLEKSGIIWYEDLPNNRLSTSRSFKRVLPKSFSRSVVSRSVNVEIRVLRISNGFTVVNMSGFQKNPNTAIEVNKIITLL